MTQDLSQWFVGAAAKWLAEVEIDPETSNQHEFNATREIQAFLGPAIPRREIPTRFLYLDDDVEPLVADSPVRYYDSRERHPTRTEPRLYYRDNTVIRAAEPGDLLLFGALRDGSATAIVARRGSTAASQLLWLFNLELHDGQSLVAVDQETFRERLTSFDAEVLLDLLGIEVDLVTSSDLDLVQERFGTTFPTTAEFSAFAREHSDGPDPLDDPDGALMAWWDAEYRFFQAFERAVVEERLIEGFLGDTAVDEFLKFSLSVQNRRKSRSGHAFENHLAAVFDAHHLAYQRGALTERKAKPDFLFPSQAAYADLSYPSGDLRMLGAKTTAKDRWRQILTEADRIPTKHLATLQPAISADQTTEMAALNVQLVIPKGLHLSYTDAQRDWLWTLRDFIFDLEGD